MNLIKSFNFNFLKQNIRKSKGGIVFSIILVPLLITLILVVMGLNINSLTFVTLEMFGMVNIIFMYIIPFLYSVALFGFVFKKPSTDFMNSIPINRKTMFVTNTVGGIILITITQVLACLMIFLCGAIFKNLIIFPMSVFQTIFLCWVSYIFVFITANLAMTFSGTAITQLVVTVLILFLIPTSIKMMDLIRDYKDYKDYSYDYNQNYDLAIVNGYQTTYFQELDKIENYTMPFKMVLYGIGFSWESILRMIILSVIYFYLGLKIYQKRKMEDSEESFGSVKLHIFVKALTLIPILLFANLINREFDMVFSAVIIILVAIYYFLFDLIVKRKVKIGISVISFIASLFIIQASITFLDSFNNNKQIDIDYDDIKSISIGLNSKVKDSYYLSYSYNDGYNKDLFLDGDYFIEDKDILDIILEAEKQNRSFDNMYKSYSSFSLKFNIKLKSGKEYYLFKTISQSNYDKIIEKLKQNQKYMKHIKDNILKLNGEYKLGNDIIKSNDKKVLEKELKNSLENLDSLKSLDKNINEDVFYIYKVVYEKNRVCYYKIPIDLSNEFMNVVVNIANKNAKNNIKGYKYSLHCSVYTKDEYVDSGFSNEKILDFIEEHVDDEFNPNKKYYIISGNLETYDGYKYFIFYTNNTKEIDKMLENYENKYYYVD